MMPTAPGVVGPATILALGSCGEPSPWGASARPDFAPQVQVARPHPRPAGCRNCWESARPGRQIAFRGALARVAGLCARTAMSTTFPAQDTSGSPPQSRDLRGCTGTGGRGRREVPAHRRRACGADEPRLLRAARPVEPDDPAGSRATARSPRHRPAHRRPLTQTGSIAWRCFGRKLRMGLLGVINQGRISTYPSVPCTRIRCPSGISRVASTTLTTAGNPYSRAITAP